MNVPAYRKLFESGELARRAAAAHALRRQNGCHLCPRECCADRQKGERGNCGIEEEAVVAYAAPYFAEEDCLTGEHGAGAIFFAGCNLGCEICRSGDISRETDIWRRVNAEELSSYMLSLMARQVHNLDLVTPTHVLPEILDALVLAAGRGLDLPVVYNTSGYDRVEALELLDGVVDVYLTDFKFRDPAVARRWAHAENYPEVAMAAIREMHRQVGDLVFDENGLAVRGLLVRHLVLPGEIGGCRDIVRFLAEEVSPRTCINIMGGYRPPSGLPPESPLGRPASREEVLDARRAAADAGLVLMETSGG
jgi:putative pyruvate formate lyase activating enzyme